MGTIFHVGNWAHLPIMDLLDSGKFKNIPVLILYGNKEDDWMWRNVPKCHDTVNSPEPLESSYLEHILKSGNSQLSHSEMHHPKTRLFHVPNSGHQLIVDNVPGVNHAILAFTHTQEVADEYKSKKAKPIAKSPLKNCN